MIGPIVRRVRTSGGDGLRRALAGDQALQPTDLASAEDPGLFGPGTPIWRVHGDSAMLIGGLRTLFLQTLHPLAMAGVSDHSDYRHDPWGRLHRTGRFIGATTFGSTEAAHQQIELVHRVHQRVVGTAPDGRPYAANDPHLLRWVAVTEIDSFLSAYRAYGSGKLTDAEADTYVAEVGRIAELMGSEPMPASVAELDEQLEAFKPELAVGAQAREAVRFLVAPPGVPLALRGPYALLTAAAVGQLPSWARAKLGLPVPPLVDPLAVRPAATVLTRTIGWLMTDGERETALAERLDQPAA